MKNPLVEKLYLFLDPQKNAQIAQAQAQYMKNQFRFLGVKAPLLKKAVSILIKEYPSKDWKKEVEALWQEESREFQYAAIFWAISQRKLVQEKDLSFLESLIITKSWWDTVDTVATNLIGFILLRYPTLVEQSERWIASENFWLRRTALLFPLRWKEKTDEKRLFSYCSKLGAEKEFFIRKAIGWTLREYSKTNPEAVKEFLQKASLSSLSMKEAKKYL